MYCYPLNWGNHPRQEINLFLRLNIFHRIDSRNLKPRERERWQMTVRKFLNSRGTSCPGSLPITIFLICQMVTSHWGLRLSFSTFTLINLLEEVSTMFFFKYPWRQWFSTFFFNSRHPSLVMQRFGRTNSYNLLINTV